MKEPGEMIPNPFPIPDLSKEGYFIEGYTPKLDKKVKWRYGWKQKLPAHSRLFSHQTLSSARKNYFFVSEHNVPKDFLDLSLTSVYEHHKDLWLPKSYTHIQPETMNIETWRTLHNKIPLYSREPVSIRYEIRYAEQDNAVISSRKKIHPSSLQLATEGPHTDRTNPGFSRKVDGTYYGI